MCNAWYDDVYYLHHRLCEKQSHQSMRGDEYTRLLRLYYRTLRRGTDNPRLLDPSALIINVLQSFGTHPDASQSSRIEPPSSTRTPGASLADSLLAYIADMTLKRKQTPAAEVGEEALPAAPPPLKKVRRVLL